ncbi:WXG100 family type VII secretion target [Streptomyces sp. WMMB303]|uniref:WXG100 family type VII secretion target n=1 Tax=Streptomyces sp. WMMB303 TaxID=3034154 RepID=UPI0023EBCEF4|nr:WXG100 family type VII secretion target [Streptomyces sp. WMMB303]MDF4251833.1 WXG100 family type VII secretion target [Streptomyces sp. WMMB303]
MSFEQEWAGLVAEARDKQSSTATQLNGADSKGDGKWLQVTPSVLDATAKKVEKVDTAFQKVDNAAMREMEQVPGSMKGFASDEAFKTFQEMWRGQMKHLRKQFANTATALRNVTAKTLEGDVYTKEQVDKIAEDRDRKEHPLKYLLDPNRKPLLSTTPQYPFSTDRYPLLKPPSSENPVYGPPLPTAPSASWPKS